MKERPILMSAPMVRAILDGRKTQTRRVVKGVQRNNCLRLKKATKTRAGIETHVIDAPKHGLCPYGVPGDRLWVKETFLPWVNTADGSFSHVAAFRADGYELEAGEQWRPSIFMPRAASRITLEVVDVRVERLLATTRGDAMAEGCPFPNMAGGANPRDWYASLWEWINGPGSWDANPWVWVVEFRRVAP